MIPVCSQLKEINVKSTSDVLAHHLKCFAARDLDGLMEDYAADAVFFTLGGVLRGREAIRGVFEKLFSEFANDVFVVRNESIQMQAFTAKIRPKH